MKLASCTMQGRTTYGVVVNNDLQIPSDEFLKLSSGPEICSRCRRYAGVAELLLVNA